MTKNTGCRIRGTHTRVAPEFSPRTTASATCDGVLDIGAGDIPSVIVPMTNPGRTSINWTPEPCSASPRPLANPSKPAFALP